MINVSTYMKTKICTFSQKQENLLTLTDLFSWLVRENRGGGLRASMAQELM